MGDAGGLPAGGGVAGSPYPRGQAGGVTRRGERQEPAHLFVVLLNVSGEDVVVPAMYGEPAFFNRVLH